MEKLQSSGDIIYRCHTWRELGDAIDGLISSGFSLSRYGSLLPQKIPKDYPRVDITGPPIPVAHMVEENSLRVPRPVNELMKSYVDALMTVMDEFVTA